MGPLARMIQSGILASGIFFYCSDAQPATLRPRNTTEPAAQSLTQQLNALKAQVDDLQNKLKTIESNMTDVRNNHNATVSQTLSHDNQLRIIESGLKEVHDSQITTVSNVLTTAQNMITLISGVLVGLGILVGVLSWNQYRNIEQLRTETKAELESRISKYDADERSRNDLIKRHIDDEVKSIHAAYDIELTNIHTKYREPEELMSELDDKIKVANQFFLPSSELKVYFLGILFENQSKWEDKFMEILIKELRQLGTRHPDGKEV